MDINDSNKIKLIYLHFTYNSTDQPYPPRYIFNSFSPGFFVSWEVLLRMSIRERKKIKINTYIDMFY